MTVIRVTKNSLQPNVDLQAYKNEAKEILGSKSPQWIFCIEHSTDTHSPDSP